MSTRTNEDVYPIVSLFVYKEYEYRGDLDLVTLDGLKPSFTYVHQGRGSYLLHSRFAS